MVRLRTRLKLRARRADFSSLQGFRRRTLGNSAEWFAGAMWTEHPALNDFGNWAAPLALGVVFLGPLTWGVTRALPQAGMGRAFGPRHSERRTHQATARVKCPKHQSQAGRLAT